MGWEWDSSSAGEVDGKFQTLIDMQMERSSAWSGVHHYLELKGRRGSELENCQWIGGISCAARGEESYPSQVLPSQPHLLTPAVPPVHPAVAIPGVPQPVTGRELLAQAPSMPPLGAHQSYQVQPPQVHLQVLLLLGKDGPCRAPCPIPVAALQPRRRQKVTGNIWPWVCLWL